MTQYVVYCHTMIYRASVWCIFVYIYIVYDEEYKVYGTLYMVHGSFQKSGALIETPSSRALPQFIIETAIEIIPPSFLEFWYMRSWKIISSTEFFWLGTKRRLDFEEELKNSQGVTGALWAEHAGSLAS